MKLFKSTILRAVVPLFISLGILAGCGEKTPSRDLIPVLKERIFVLQKAIENQNRASIDSLLSLRILRHGQNSDSLLSFCWGSDNEHVFARLGDCGIAYTHGQAIVDCYVVDSSGNKIRPIHLEFIYEHNLWLLSRFSSGMDTSAISE